MHWAKKITFGSMFTVFAFIAMIFGEVGGVGLFSTGFLTMAGLGILLTMGVFETLLVTW